MTYPYQQPTPAQLRAIGRQCLAYAKQLRAMARWCDRNTDTDPIPTTLLRAAEGLEAYGRNPG